MMIDDFFMINEGEGAGAAGCGDCGVGGEGGSVSIGDGAASIGNTGISDTGSPVEVATGNTTAMDTGILGKCNHTQHGFMGKNCFHIPSRVICPFYRWPTTMKKNKKQKKLKFDNQVEIKPAKTILEEDEFYHNGKIKYVYGIPHDKIINILKNSPNSNDKFELNQIEKLIGGDIEFLCSFKEYPTECLAVAALAYGTAECEDCYVNELQSLQPTFGSDLLLKIIREQKNVWLLARPNCDEKLIEFYRKKIFNFNEYVLPDSIWDCPIHFFYTKSCDEDKLRRHIDDVYSHKDLDETEQLNQDTAKQILRKHKNQIKSEKDVQNVIDDYNANRQRLDIRIDNSLELRKFNDEITMIVMFLKDVLSGNYKSSWLAISFSAAIISYLLSSDDGMIDDVAVLKYALKFINDDFQKYKGIYA